jgi:hypothetical protein
MSLARIPVLSIFGVPAAATAVALIGNATLEGQWRDAVSGHAPGAAPIDLSTACALIGGQDETCTIHAALGWILPLAIATVVIAFLIAATISFAVSTGGSDPYRIARIFRPVLFTTIAAALVLAVLDGILIILAAWYGEPAITGYRHPYVALAAGAAVAVAAVGVILGVAPDYHELVLEGLVANAIAPWPSVFGAPAVAKPQSSNELPYVVESRDPGLAQVLRDIWPHSHAVKAWPKLLTGL